MSRTRRGTKPMGYDYWTKRLGNSRCSGFGPWVKRMTHRLERLRDRALCRNADFKDYEERLTEEEYIDRKKREE